MSLTDATTYNKIAVEPFPDKSIKTEAHGDGEFKIVKIVNTKTNLVRLRVLYDARFALGNSAQLVEAGRHVWVRANQYTADWGKDVFEDPTNRAVKFILLPIDRIEVFE